MFLTYMKLTQLTYKYKWTKKEWEILEQSQKDDQ